MQVKILLFGTISEIVGKSSIEIENIHDLNALKEYLPNRYTALKSLKYRYAVNKKFSTGNQKFNDGDEISVIPPYGGG